MINSASSLLSASSSMAHVHPIATNGPHWDAAAMHPIIELPTCVKTMHGHALAS
jgi:hypothetical protein